MPVASLPDLLLLRIDRQLPLNRQIYQIIREAILNQILPTGMQLPSTRDLARALAMSRNTVTYAYDQLLAEGYLETRTGAGTFITDTTPDDIQLAALPRPARSGSNTAGSAPPRSALSARGIAITQQAGVSDRQLEAFMPGIPDVSRFPHKIWNRLQNKYWRRSHPELLTYGQGGGHLPLRAAIAEYLRSARSVNCQAEQVLITTGIHQSLDIIVKLLGENGDAAWVEDPCYWGTRSVLNSLDIKTVPIAVDAEGLPLEHTLTPPRFICTTPSHQYPLGMVMSLSRRRLLLEYAAAHQSWIIEDDYDSEFRYGSAPLASLQGMDRQDRVLYMGTFSKTMFPGLRIGFLVVPEALATAFASGSAELYRGSQLFLQATLADFMGEGYFASHIRKMRLLYAERLQLLQAAIREFLPPQLVIMGGEAGLHLTLMLPAGCSDQAISNEARAAGIIARPLSRYYMHADSARQGLLLGYANTENEQIRPIFKRLAQIILRHLPPYSD